MAGDGDFTTFTVRSVESLIRQGVAEFLRADTQIAQFLGATALDPGPGWDTSTERLFTLPSLCLPDRPCPFAVVYLAGKEPTPMLSREYEHRVQIGVGLVFNLEQETLADAEQSVEDFFNRVEAVLFAHLDLKGSSMNGGAPLAVRLDAFEPTTWDFFTGKSDAGEDVVTALRQSVATYIAYVQAPSGLVAGQTP